MTLAARAQDPKPMSGLIKATDIEYPQWGKNYLLPFPDDYVPPDGDDEAAN
jgi:hypothetical protein